MTGKRIKKAYEGIDRTKFYSLQDAVKELKSRAKTKFDETVEIAMNLGIDPKHADQNVRGVVSLPHGTGKTVRLVGADDLAEMVQAGKMDFDRVIATPDMMVTVGKLGKVLGPRGLMPNPKLGTVTNDVAEAVKAAKGGQVEFRAEKAGLVHAGVGKVSFSEADLVANVKAFVSAINKAKPAGAKGTYIKKVSLASTMGPGMKLDVAVLVAAD